MRDSSLPRFAARIGLAASDVAFPLVIALVLTLGFASPAYAYVDPSVMTYTIQALAGVAVALSAVLGVVWRRMRRHLLHILRIDENEGKQVEGAVHALDPLASDYRDRLDRAESEARRMKAEQSSSKPETLCWRARFLFSLAASLMLVYTFAVVAPLEIVASSVNSLLFTVTDVWVPFAVFGLAGTVVLALALSLLRGRAFNVCFAVVAAVGVAGFVQALFLNGSLPAADGTQVVWDDYTTATVVSAAVWIVLIGSAVFLSLRKSLAFKGAAVALCLVGVVAQSVSLGVLLTAPAPDGLPPVAARHSVTTDGVSEVSSNGNIIMFVLDTYDTLYLEEGLEEEPGCLDEFTGFTWFDNSTGSMIPTRYAMASMLTGQSLDEGDEGFSTSLIIDWYEQHGLIDDINAQGYETRLYATDINDAIGSLSERVENIKLRENRLDYPSAVAMLVKCSLYRDLPWALKPPFWFYTDEVNSAALGSGAESAVNALWTMNDARYYATLKEQGLSAADLGEKGSFRVIHLAGPHPPYTLNRNAETVEDGTGAIEQGLGSLHIVSAYLEELKRLGLYDEATIVVTADHGEWYIAEDIVRATSPIMLVKPSTQPGGSDEPVKRSSVPTGHVDLAATLLEAAGGDASAYGGMSVFDVPDAPRPRYYNASSVVGPEHVYTSIIQWEIDGDAMNWDDWRETGVRWPIG